MITCLSEYNVDKKKHGIANIVWHGMAWPPTGATSGGVILMPFWCIA